MYGCTEASYGTVQDLGYTYPFYIIDILRHLGVCTLGSESKGSLIS